MSLRPPPPPFLNNIWKQFGLFPVSRTRMVVTQRIKIKYIYNRYDALVKQLKYQRFAYSNHRLTHRRKCMILSHLQTAVKTLLGLRRCVKE